MSLSDFLAIADIGITLLVGFYLTHALSIRDSRVRALKDFYIDELKDLSADICSTFSKLSSGRCTGADFVHWHDGIDSQLEIFDNDVRSTFPILDKNLSQILFDAFRDISSTEDFNNSYNQLGHHYDTETSNKIKLHDKNIRQAVHSLIESINNAPRHGITFRTMQCIRYEWNYFKSSGHAVRSCLFHWLKRILYYLFIWGVTLFLLWLIYGWMQRVFFQPSTDWDEKKVESLQKAVGEMNLMNEKIDSLNCGLRQIENKLKVRNRVINHYIHTDCYSESDSVLEHE